MSAVARSVVVANAGSGKTYLLANRLVRWMIESLRRTDGDAGADRILAITFTRKAAGEILERVLAHLAMGVLDEEARGPSRFGDPSQVGPASEDEYAAVLQQVVDAMHRMSISTIDGFFVRLAGAFGPALGLPDGWRISEDDEDGMQRDQAVAAVIADDRDRAVELAKRMSQGAPRATVRSSIRAALDVPLAVWERTSLGDDPARAWAVLRDRGVRIFKDAEPATDEAFARAIAELREAALPAGLSKRWPGAREKYAQLAADGAWDAVVTASFGAGIHATGRYDRGDATTAIRDAVTVIHRHALACLEDGVRARIGATAELAERVSAELRRIRAEDGAYQFGEITSRIAHAWRAGDGPGGEEIRELLDRGIADIAIDEFQDTSPMQWTAIRPLVEQALSSRDGRFLVVGDPKQSIYGWRGGTPALLAQVGARAEMQPDVVLDRSFRSSPTVLEFVNAVFADLPARAAERCKRCGGNAELLRAAGIVPPEHADEDPVMRVLRSWSFVPHRPADRNGRLPGMIRAIRVGEGQQAAADAVAEIVAQRVAARPGVRIAVLARKNPMVSACAAAIRRRGIAVSDEGRSELLDSPAVLAVLACLRLADQPDDRVAHWLVTREPLRSALGLRPMESFERPVDCTRQADRISADMRQQLAEQGLVAWIDSMTDRLRPTCGARDLERLRQLSALAHGMPADHALDPGRFVRAVEERLQRAGANERVRVMTIHASKGLEFDEVVLASTTESLTAMRADANRWVAIAPDPAGAPVAVGPVVSQKLEAHAPLLQAFRRESEVATAFDSISAFYVALTRAKQAIHLACAPMKGKQAAAVTPFFLVSSAFDGFARAFGAAQEGACFWSMGDTELGATPQPAPAPEPGTVPAVEWAPRPGARIVAPPSSHERADGRPTLLDEFEGLPDAARGSLAHGWFEGIEWLPPGGPDLSRDHEVREAVALQIRRPVPDDLADRVRQLVVRACGSEIGAALRPARYDRWGCERVEVRNEVPYVTHAGGGIQRGRIDRLVLGYRGGRVVRAEVLDHKTGAKDLVDDALTARIAPYRAQMAGYRRVVASMFGIEPAAVSTVLLMLDRGEVIPVTEP